MVDRRPSSNARPQSVPAKSAAERQTAARLSALLELQCDAPLRVTVGSEAGQSVDLSPSLRHVLRVAADMVSTGADVTVLARNEELTSQQAADFLNVSRQYMVRLLERGDIASTKVGTHRRVRAVDLAQYRHRRDEGRAAALAEMADEAEAAGGYDAPAAFGPRNKVGLSIPLKTANTERLAAVLARAAELAKDRDPAADTAALAEMGIDPTDWSVSAVRDLTTSHC